ncbi:hypothetical protein G647_05082 [Cladophialophora carrionii CBS 160.54]|uniref:Uncharacterized protein n=1 Tax=Cladophialophora carrionii CBS 160.54 TaxID=1279043 RepID=V9DBD5_9EURO|nr:uncharacterized protein G647_05082 [Cladophialophora carrionii CBS 160.54]ETI23282.1 hypothetical protein G647_05082 [Cladophialophora carrionii CBS 160.54]
MWRLRPSVAVIAAVSVLLLWWHLPRYPDADVKRLPVITTQYTPEGATIEYLPGTPKGHGQSYTKTVVVARQESEDVSWLETSSLNVSKAIYVVDKPSLSPGYEIPRNKGHEAMVYLSYIIDHYDDLSDVSIFVHAHRTTWHNNDLLDSDMIKTIEHLSDAHVIRAGYFNLRCHHEPGCPDWLHLDRPDEELDTHRKMEERAFSLAVWTELHPNVLPPPKAISQPCCAQFAVSRDRIRAIPREEYVRYRDWILHTELSDVFSGRVMEYTWQFLFAGVSELCPAMHVCYCDGYGICFGGAEQFQQWFDMRAEMRRLQAEEEVPAEAEEARARVRDTEARLEQLKQEAFARGSDPRQRALEAGRPWREGDGF